MLSHGFSFNKKNAVHFYKAPNEKPEFLKSPVQAHICLI